MDVLPEVLGFVRERATMGKVRQRPNGQKDAIEPRFGLIKTDLLLNVPREVIQVGYGLR